MECLHNAQNFGTGRRAYWIPSPSSEGEGRGEGEYRHSPPHPYPLPLSGERESIKRFSLFSTREGICLFGCGRKASLGDGAENRRDPPDPRNPSRLKYIRKICLDNNLTFYRMLDMRHLPNPSRLRGRRQRVPRDLPPFEHVLRASLFRRRIRCGKPGCHCAKGKGHPIAYLSTTFSGGRTRQISLPSSLVPLARRWVRAYHRWWQAIEEISEQNREILRRRWVDPETGSLKIPS